MAIGLMEVLLVNAKGLQDSDFLGQAGRPVWNEKFTFKVEYPGSGHQYKLILKIMDKDTFSMDDFVGEATIYLEDLLALGVEKGSAEMHPRKYRVIQADNNYCGEIEVGVTFSLKVEDGIDDETYGGWKESHF